MSIYTNEHMKSSWGWWECHSACSSIKCCTRPWLDNGCCRKSQKFAKVITIHPMSDLDDETKIQHSQADISVWMISTSQRNSMVHLFCQYLGKTTFWLLTFFFFLKDSGSLLLQCRNLISLLGFTNSPRKWHTHTHTSTHTYKLNNMQNSLL